MVAMRFMVFRLTFLRGLALLLLALSLLLTCLFFLFGLSCLCFLDLLGILAEFVTNVLMRNIALLRPHVIVRNAAESKS